MALIIDNVVKRTFHVEFGKRKGTAFTIDHQGRQYLITAKHLLEELKEFPKCVKIFSEKKWISKDIKVVGCGKGKVDIVVLACQEQLSEKLPMKPSVHRLGYSQPVYFVGFPFGLHSGNEQINRGFPIPFVKMGIVGAVLLNDRSTEQLSIIYIDGHGNEGFSGGPVVYKPRGGKNTYNVAGVVTCIIDSKKPQVKVYDRNKTKKIGYAQENLGIVQAIDIRYAIDLIKKKPIGYKLVPN